ncbi:PLP-dependent aminotransferase family protein [Thiolinea disciformis]|uniref:aminotransferase-like domain-containing protein n=1 Tax=Thiolinea disciformis TaxID=125614 RepID=UPI0003785AFC|nr:PLP-dependent aminotransferase family protein [Thiolinea disciformis]
MPLDHSQLQLNKQLTIPLARQLYQQLHQQIVSGNLSYAERLPSSRELAEQLQLSRGVVVECYEMLRLDHLVLGFGKGGTQICYQPYLAKPLASKASTKLGLSAQGRLIATARDYMGLRTPLLLQTSLPDLRLFPKRAWLKVQCEALEQLQGQYERSGGVSPLKLALKEFLARYRGIQVQDLNCLLISTGTQGALSALARALLNPNDVTVVEHPGWEGGKAALRQAQAHLVSVDLDQEGALVPTIKAKLAVITPNAQFPTGYVMSAARRKAWLEYSIQHNCWLIEDDFAAEYSYQQHPAPSLLSYPQAQHVIHLGTMSKLLLPDLRLSWMVVPASIADELRKILNTLGLQPSYLLQHQLALFMQYGYLAKHLAQTRSIYNQRRQWCTTYLQQHGADILEVMPSLSGMNTYLKLKESLHTENLEFRLKQAGFGCEIYRLIAKEKMTTYLLLGHAKLSEEQLETVLGKFLNVLRN